MSGLDFKTETLYKVYDNIVGQIKFCDTKTGLLIASSGIIFGILFTIFKHLNDTSFSLNQQSLILISLFGNIVSLTFYIVSVFPRKGTDIDTIFYWGKICTLQIDEYHKIISALNESDVIKDLTNQIFYLSKICDEKMSYFKYGTFMLILSILSAGLLYFSVYA